MKFFKSAASMGIMPVGATEYVRFRSLYPSSSGFKIGVFGLVNVLGRRGMLTPAEERLRRENNDWYNAAYPEPDIYGLDINPLAGCWFKVSSCEMVSRVSGYLAILDAHCIAWEEVRATDRERSCTRIAGRWWPYPRQRPPARCLDNLGR